MAGDAFTRYVTDLARGEFLADAKSAHSFGYLVEYYRRSAVRKRVWFRTLSTLLIALSAGLPVYAAFTWPLFGISKDVAVGVTSGMIAFLTGLLSFYRWEVAWRGQNEALFALVSLRAQWDGAIAAAEAMPDDQAIAFVREAYDRFTARTFEVVHAEMGEFFKVQRPPSAKSS